MKKWSDLYTRDELILYEDEHFIAINKPPGIKSQDDPTPDTSLLSWMEKEKRGSLHLVNRLDRPVSGVILLSKGKKGNRLIQDQNSLDKTYVAIISPIDKETGTLTHYTKKDGKRKKAIISDEEINGFRQCTLKFELVHRLDNYHLLKIRTFSGRFHQIRAQLAHIGHPIRGDVKYGARRSNADRSIDLHAVCLTIPGSGEEVTAIPLGREKIWQDLNALDLF